MRNQLLLIPIVTGLSFTALANDNLHFKFDPEQHSIVTQVVITDAQTQKTCTLTSKQHVCSMKTDQSDKDNFAVQYYQDYFGKPFAIGTGNVATDTPDYSSFFIAGQYTPVGKSPINMCFNIKVGADRQKTCGLTKHLMKVADSSNVEINIVPRTA